MSEPHDHHRNCHHSRCYQMSCEDFDELYAYAQGRCQICQTPEAETTRGILVIDHAPHYSSLAVRGLLCDKCNSLMRHADAGRYVPEAYPYWHDAWFMRVLRKRRAAQFRVAS